MDFGFLPDLETVDFRLPPDHPDTMRQLNLNARDVAVLPAFYIGAPQWLNKEWVGTLYPADFVGRPYADAAPFTVTAIADSEICAFARRPFERLLEANVNLERQLLRQAFAALDETRVQMLPLTRRTATEKIAGFLLDMASREETSCSRATPAGPVTFDLPLNRGQIADVLGLTIETVSRQLTKLKIAGIIALPGVRSVTIRDEAALRAAAA